MQISLRYHHPDGTSKDWFIEETSDGLLIQWGRTGATLQSKTIPASQCHPSVREEMMRRVARKEAKGYRRMSVVRTVDNLPPQFQDEIRKVTEAVREVISNTPGIPSRTPAEALTEWAGNDNSRSWF